MVYQNSSIEKLASAISKLMNDDTSEPSDQLTSFDDRDRINAMTSMVQKYTQGLGRLHQEPHTHSKDSNLQVALIGSTGSLGPHLLRRLIKHPRITRVWCLDRSDHAKDKHEKSKMMSQLDQSFISYYKVNLSQPHLGLAEEDLSALKVKVDVIVHNAWKVDFNQSLTSFEDHIRGTRSLIDWSITSPKQPRVVFMSSISSVANWSQVHGHGLVPSVPVSDYRVASRMGYGESKLVAENTLDQANDQAGVSVSVLRIGQIAGSTNPIHGVWPSQEWLPSLLKTSRTIGMVPKDLPDIDWIPIDKLADVVAEIIDADYGTDDHRVYNVVNPQTVPWSLMLGVFKTYCGAHCSVVPLDDWLDELEKTKVDTLGPSELAAKPALKILRVLRELMDVKTVASYDTARSVGASVSLGALGPVRQEWMQSWLEQWMALD